MGKPAAPAEESRHDDAHARSGPARNSRMARRARRRPRARGPRRARRSSLERIVERAQTGGAQVERRRADAVHQYDSGLRSSRYMPGNDELETRMRHYIRWNAMAMVVRANEISSELGGHVASFASSATLYDVGFNHFFRAPSENVRRRPRLLPRSFIAGRLRARVPRGTHQRRAAGELPPRGRRQRAFVVSASVADAGLLAVRDGLDGARPDPGDLSGALPEVLAQSRHRRHERPQGLVLHRRRRKSTNPNRSVRSPLRRARVSTI